MKIIKLEDYAAKSSSWFRVKDLQVVRRIIRDVYRRGDQALIYWSKKFDQLQPSLIRLSAKKRKKIIENSSPEFDRAICFAAENIRQFCCQQLEQLKPIVCPAGQGVILKQLVQPLRRVGVYVPAGRNPLVSSLLMGVVPAIVAGVEEIVVVSPPVAGSGIHPLILTAGAILGVKEFYALGGAQAIAALAYGTETFQGVEKVVGPGNKYVALAKKELFGTVGIDLVAGPSEILVMGEEPAAAELIAADLLAQAEHDPAARAIFVTTSIKLAQKVNREIKNQLALLANPQKAKLSLRNNGAILIAQSVEAAIAFANRLAPEHLSLHSDEYIKRHQLLYNFGSLFFPAASCEVYADYCSGLNHILPTASTARFSSGLSVRDFLKFPTVLEVQENSLFLEQIQQVAEFFARLEGLEAHQRAVALRAGIKIGVDRIK